MSAASNPNRILITGNTDTNDQAVTWYSDLSQIEAYYGSSGPEAAAARVFFSGTPGAQLGLIRIGQGERPHLLGGNLSGIPLSDLQSVQGSLGITLMVIIIPPNTLILRETPASPRWLRQSSLRCITTITRRSYPIARSSTIRSRSRATILQVLLPSLLRPRGRPSRSEGLFQAPASTFAACREQPRSFSTTAPTRTVLANTTPRRPGAAHRDARAAHRDVRRFRRSGRLHRLHPGGGQAG